MTVTIEHWGQLDYAEAQQRQEYYVEEILSGKRDESIIFCSHHPVVTLGKNASPSEVFSWKGAVHQARRGGKATYHGPGQVICYPLLNLKQRQYNLGGLLDALESAVVKTLEQQYSLVGTANPQRNDPQKTGVWVNGKKVASLGLALRKWVTYHGLAINLFEDPLAFKGINPCGGNSEMMASIESILNMKPNKDEFESNLYKSLLSGLPPISR